MAFEVLGDHSKECLMLKIDVICVLVYLVNLLAFTGLILVRT